MTIPEGATDVAFVWDAPDVLRVDFKMSWGVHVEYVRIPTPVEPVTR